MFFNKIGGEFLKIVLDSTQNRDFFFKFQNAPVLPLCIGLLGDTTGTHAQSCTQVSGYTWSDSSKVWYYLELLNLV